jgi:hypothetical protein
MRLLGSARSSTSLSDASTLRISRRLARWGFLQLSIAPTASHGSLSGGGRDDVFWVKLQKVTVCVVLESPSGTTDQVAFVSAFGISRQIAVRIARPL